MKKVLEIDNCSQCYHFDDGVYTDLTPKCTQLNRRIEGYEIPNDCVLRGVEIHIATITKLLADIITDKRKHICIIHIGHGRAFCVDDMLRDFEMSRNDVEEVFNYLKKENLIEISDGSVFLTNWGKMIFPLINTYPRFKNES